MSIHALFTRGPAPTHIMLVCHCRYFGSICMQKEPDPYWPTPMTEACLDINIYAPVRSLNSNDKLPVMLWYHGGGYMVSPMCNDVYHLPFCLY
jgi:carboxylesterase type B